MNSLSNDSFSAMCCKRKISSLEDELSEKFISTQCQTIKNESKDLSEIPKKKQKREFEGKKQIYIFQMVMKNRDNYLRDMKSGFYKMQEDYLFRPIETKRIYFVAGDILIEPREPTEQGDGVQSGKVMNYFRNIVSVEKGKTALSFKMESIKPLKFLDEVIHCLEYSQDANNYEYAQYLKKYQTTVFLIQDLITEVIDLYSQNPGELQKLLKEREEFLLNEKKKFIEELAKKGVFAGVGVLSLSFQNKATQMVDLSLLKYSVAILGADLDSAAQYLLHKGFMNFFDHASRRILFRATMEQQQNIYSDINITIPSFEIVTTDGISVVCQCEISNRHVNFPDELRFKGSRMNKLNDIEQLILLNFKVTLNHLNSVISIRKKIPSNLTFEQQSEFHCFEYGMRSAIFLEKYYPDKCNELKCNINKKYSSEQCGYRLIK